MIDYARPARTARRCAVVGRIRHFRIFDIADWIVDNRVRDYSGDLLPLHESGRDTTE